MNMCYGVSEHLRNAPQGKDTAFRVYGGEYDEESISLTRPWTTQILSKYPHPALTHILPTYLVPLQDPDLSHILPKYLHPIYKTLDLSISYPNSVIPFPDRGQPKSYPHTLIPRHDHGRTHI